MKSKKIQLDSGVNLLEDSGVDSLKDLDKYMKINRSNDMLTVQDLIDYLKTQNPKACVLGFEQNSNAYIEQSKNIPNNCVLTVKEDKKMMKKQLKSWYRGDSPEIKRMKINNEIKTIYRYSNDDDVIFNIGN